MQPETAQAALVKRPDVRCLCGTGRRPRSSGLPRSRVHLLRRPVTATLRHGYRHRPGRAAPSVRVPPVRHLALGSAAVLESHTADPFQLFADATEPGQRLPGTVTKLVPFGAFVQVARGIEGLVHVSEIAWTPVEDPSDVVQLGDEITVVVTAVDRSRRRLSLSRRQALRAPNAL
ncbi:S1 RNA-binding domain-containing protein [Streptomyces sp. NPDC127069]|uniref:S1 RNA-binding domain-containing protein n=1 Tax=Streptomyces sp. NPDC127069 TaxID=3347128 RepID=UPI00365270A9